MTSWEYTVIDTEGCIVATNMRLEDALILIKALMLEYYADPCMSFTIKRNELGEET